jgi:very-short-patch-repair endonuclease
VASAQHGVVTREQLLNLGMTPMQIRRRMRGGGLLRQHRGVYRVGHRAPSVEATYLAAVVAVGEGARLSGLAAAYLCGLVKGAAPTPEVTSLRERRIEGVRTHRCRSFDAKELIRVRGIPVTSPARTLVDIADRLSPDALARACHEAGVRHGVTPAAVIAVLARLPTTPGARKLRHVIEGDVHVTLSKLEAQFLALLRDQGLPMPVTNRPAGGRRVDCRWPGERLTIELDGYRFHNSRHAWEQDRRREREARARGDDFRRFTYGDVFEQPTLMVRELHAFFSARRPG